MLAHRSIRDIVLETNFNKGCVAQWHYVIKELIYSTEILIY